MPPKTSKKLSTAPVSKGIIIEKLNVLIQPLKARHERHYKDRYFHFWADMLLAGVLIALVTTLAWLIFWQPRPDFALEARFTSARVVSGDIDEFVISYENEEGSPIGGVVLTLELPKTFIVQSATPEILFDNKSNTFALGDLDKGAKGELRIKGIVQGEIGERQFIGLNLMYQYGQIKKQVLNSIVYNVDGSVIELSLEAPDNAYEGVSFNGTVEVKNSGNAVLNNAALLLPKTDWEISADQYDFNDGLLKLPALAPGEIKQVAFEATPLQGLGNKDFIVESVLMIDNTNIRQSKLARQLAVSEPELNVGLNFKKDVFEGNEAGLAMTFKNNGEAEISNLNLSFTNKRETMAVTRISSEQNNFSAVNNSLAYQPVLAAGEAISTELTVYFERRGNALNDFLNLSVAVSYMMDGKSFNYSIAAPRLKINSNLSVNSGGYYYGPQGDQLGIGPIPPKVDIPTTYWIIWEANNLGNDIAEFEVRGDLPTNVVWLDQQSLVAGGLSYSPIGRRVLWKVDQLGQTGGNYRASFAVSIVPRAEDLGKVPDLLSNLNFSGLDLYTGVRISKKLANITTNIESDRQAAGKGRVESLE